MFKTRICQDLLIVSFLNCVKQPFSFVHKKYEKKFFVQTFSVKLVSALTNFSLKLVTYC